jgi:hypothetical protein
MSYKCPTPDHCLDRIDSLCWRLLRPRPLVVSPTFRSLGRVEGTMEMWNSLAEGMVESLFPWARAGGGRSFLGRWMVCTHCDGRGYTRKSAIGWQACPGCYAGRCLVSEADHSEGATARSYPAL